MAYAAPVTAVNTSNVNIALPGSGAWDGVLTSTFTAGTTRLLCVGQATTSQNGVWIWNGTGNPLTRPAASGDQYKSGNTFDNATLIPVLKGTTYAGTCWGIEPSATVVVDTGPHKLTRVVLPMVQARAASPGTNFTIGSAITTIDGVGSGSTPPLTGNGAAGSDIILLKDQTTPPENGLYWVNTGGAQVRCTEPLVPSRKVLVSEGTTGAHTDWVLNTQGAITVGTTSISFSRQLLRANIRDFVAVGDGVTSDTAAIASAIAAVSANNGTVVFPLGTYKLGTSTTFPSNVVGVRRTPSCARAATAVRRRNGNPPEDPAPPKDATSVEPPGRQVAA